MTIPDFQSIMLPLLRLASDGQEHRFREAVEDLATHFGLTNSERLELLPSGKYPTFDSRVSWANTYMKKAGLIESSRRGYLNITDRGMELLNSKPVKIDSKFLRRYEDFVRFKTRDGVSNDKKLPDVNEADEQTPVESIEIAYGTIRRSLGTELIEQVKSCSPGFFEKLVVEVLVAMGYGGTREDAGSVIGGSGDEGVDGVINEDRLGLDVIYIQAKRWENTVGRPEIQKFVGALLGKKARKGIFITTSDFSKNARDYASSIESSVVLIDGEALANLMIDYNVGATVESSYEIKRIDSDYFDEV
jgi:restriction system protein